MRPRARLVSCLQLLWTARMLGALYVALLAAAVAYVVSPDELRGWVSEVGHMLMQLGLLLLLAAILVGRLTVRRYRDEKEAALALIQMAHERGAFCVKAELTARAVAYWLVSLLTALTLLLLLQMPLYIAFPVSLALFVFLYFRALDDILTSATQELELVHRMKKAYEEIQR